MSSATDVPPEAQQRLNAFFRAMEEWERGSNRLHRQTMSGDCSEADSRAQTLLRLRQVLAAHTIDASDERGLQFQRPPEYEVSALGLVGWQTDGKDIVAIVRQSKMFGLRMRFRLRMSGSEWRIVGRDLEIDGHFRPSHL